MMSAMNGTRIAAATELLLDAKWRPMDSGSDSSSLRSAKSQSRNLRLQTQWPLPGRVVGLGVLAGALHLPPPCTGPSSLEKGGQSTRAGQAWGSQSAGEPETVSQNKTLKESSPLEASKHLSAIEILSHETLQGSQNIQHTKVDLLWRAWQRCWSACPLGSPLLLPAPRPRLGALRRPRWEPLPLSANRGVWGSVQEGTALPGTLAVSCEARRRTRFPEVSLVCKGPGNCLQVFEGLLCGRGSAFTPGS